MGNGNAMKWALGRLIYLRLKFSLAILVGNRRGDPLDCFRCIEKGLSGQNVPSCYYDDHIELLQQDGPLATKSFAEVGDMLSSAESVGL